MDNRNFTIGRLYSRENGWNNGITVKYFNSSVITNIPNIDEINLDGKKGSWIIKHVDKNIYPQLFNECSVYGSYWFYYGDELNITSQESL
jgi:hypothetical protein